MMQTFGNAIPVLRVASLRASIDYYVGALGFTLDWEGEVLFASVSRDRCTLFLCQGDQGNPGVWMWIGVKDAGALEQEFRSRGARIRHGCTNYYWAYEMQVEDLDGHVLRFGSEPIAGQPQGEWLDMHRRAWPPSES